MNRNPSANLVHYKELAAKTLRKDAPHPDTCPTLKIHGMAWAIPPRGQRVAPALDEEGNVTGISADTADSWPEIEALRKAIKWPDDVVCPQCGQATGTSMEVTEGVLTAAFALAIRALRAQYDLTPLQLVALLAYEDTPVPEWFQPLLRWSLGLPTEAPEEVMPSLDWAAAIHELTESPRAAPAHKAWWKFWK